MDLIGGLPVTLVVKAPNEKIADQTVECETHWTIKELKQHLSDVYPNRPTETQQRIIYSGKLLQDHLVLKDVLKKYEDSQTTHTVHLVCSGGTETRRIEVHDSPGRSTVSSRSSSVAARPETGVPSPVPATPEPGTEGLRHRSVSGHSSQQYDEALPENTQAFMPDNTMYVGGNMMYPGMMAYSPEQMAWMQQMYAQQMIQYMQYYQQGGFPTPPPSPYAAEAPHMDVAANQNEANAPRANQRAAGGGNNPQIRMNAQGGAVVDDDEDEDGGNRDWLDWVYTMSRFMVLLSIVYFYSTFSRFIMVFSLFVIVYLYQGGWFALQRRRGAEDQPAEEEEPRPEEPVAEPPQQQQPDRQPEDGQGTEPGEEASETTETTPDPQPPQGPGALYVAWSFFSTFFTSLVPEQPPPVNIN